MRKTEVPQDACLLEGQQEVCYAVDENGRYVLAPSSGWEPANIANIQAWELIREQVAAVFAAVREGRKSPLAYHMARHQMDPALLGSYVGLPRWRVRRHLRPAVFTKLKPALLERYAVLLKISVAELCTVPERPEIVVPRIDE
ncbi:MAG: hypothetical protein IH614_06380 [Desulfuromonadales bacterium]|nr:hypothetical protein [Desulfuromonadales bacterium]